MEANTVLLVICAALLGIVVYLLLEERARRSPGSSEASPSAITRLSELERARRQGEEILERMVEGVLVLDEGLKPILANGAARNLLGLQPVSLPPRLPSEEIIEVAGRAVDRDSLVEEVVGVWFPSKMDLRVRAARLDDRGAVVVLLQDVTEELRTQGLRKEFVAHASHELKSPVAGLQSLAEAIEHAVDNDPETAQRFAQRLVAEAGRLSRLIADLLDLSRLEDGNRVTVEPVDLSEVISAEVDQQRGPASAKGVDLEATIPPSIRIQGDKQQLGVLVRNLLENAIQYTSSGGGVEVNLQADGEVAVISVTDTGVGIPQEAQGRVFERFFRVDRARSREKGGTGLGLAIVKHVAELHGGTVGVTSELGRGSTFTARIPSLMRGSRGLRSVG